LACNGPLVTLLGLAAALLAGLLLIRLTPLGGMLLVGLGSAKNLAWRLLEAWRNARLSAQQIHHWHSRSDPLQAPVTPWPLFQCLLPTT